MMMMYRGSENDVGLAKAWFEEVGARIASIRRI